MDKAGDILKLFLDRTSLSAASNYSSFFRSWKEIAGEDISAHSSVADIEKGVLIVHVDHPGWIQVIQLNYRKILKKIQSRYPELGIKKIYLKLYETKRKENLPERTKETVQNREKNSLKGDVLTDALLRLGKIILEKNEEKSVSERTSDDS